MSAPCSTFKIFCITLLACLSSLPCLVRAQEGALRIPSLFSPECSAIAYEPVSVYDAPGGLRIGQLVLDHPEYALKTMKVCSYRPVAYLRPEGRQNEVEIGLSEVAPREPALTVYKSQETGNLLWVQGRTRTGAFWLPVVGGRQFVSLERDLVQGLARLTENCTPLGQCTPVPDEVAKLATRAGQERVDTCFGNAYEIDGVVELPGGRKAYQVHLADILYPKYADKLPLEALVPVHDYRGHWTGFFDANGC